MSCVVKELPELTVDEENVAGVGNKGQEDLSDLTGVPLHKLTGGQVVRQVI